MEVGTCQGLKRSSGLLYPCGLLNPSCHSGYIQRFSSCSSELTNLTWEKPIRDLAFRCSRPSEGTSPGHDCSGVMLLLKTGWVHAWFEQISQAHLRASSCLRYGGSRLALELALGPDFGLSNCLSNPWSPQTGI